MKTLSIFLILFSSAAFAGSTADLLEQSYQDARNKDAVREYKIKQARETLDISALSYEDRLEMFMAGLEKDAPLLVHAFGMTVERQFVSAIYFPATFGKRFNVPFEWSPGLVSIATNMQGKCNGVVAGFKEYSSRRVDTGDLRVNSQIAQQQLMVSGTAGQQRGVCSTLRVAQFYQQAQNYQVNSVAGSGSGGSNARDALISR